MPRLQTTPERLASAPRSPRLPIPRALARVGFNVLGALLFASPWRGRAMRPRLRSAIADFSAYAPADLNRWTHRVGVTLQETPPP